MAFESIHYKTTSIFFQEYNSFLQLSPNKMVGDWYFFEYHTKNTIYSSKFQHFLFPKLQTPIIFPLEFIRKILPRQESQYGMQVDSWAHANTNF